MPFEISLGELSTRLGAKLVGDENLHISHIDDLTQAGPDGVSFVSSRSFLKDLPQTRAAAVILRAEDVELCPTAALIVDDPYLAYAKTAQLLDTAPTPVMGIHANACIDPDAIIGKNVSINACAVISKGVNIGENVRIGAGCFVGENVQIEDNVKLDPNVTVHHGVKIGQRTIIHSGAVIGADGFGFANENGKWVKIPQLGGVIIGDDVEIGANTTIDRAALRDTRIGNGVKLDNLIQIAHNVEIGDDAAMAAFVGIAGSSKIGKGCTLAGGVSIIGHLDIPDGTHFTVRTLATKSPEKSGAYSSGTLMMENHQWLKNTARFKQLDQMAKQIKQLEKQISNLKNK